MVWLTPHPTIFPDSDSTCCARTKNVLPCCHFRWCSTNLLRIRFLPWGVDRRKWCEYGIWYRQLIKDIFYAVFVVRASSVDWGSVERYCHEPDRVSLFFSNSHNFVFSRCHIFLFAINIKTTLFLNIVLNINAYFFTQETLTTIKKDKVILSFRRTTKPQAITPISQKQAHQNVFINVSQVRGADR